MSPQEALYSLFPSPSLTLAVSLSILAHGAFLHGVKPQARAAAVHHAHPERLSVRLITSRTATLSPLVPEKMQSQRSDRRRESPVTTAPNPLSAPAAPEDAVEGMAEFLAPAVLSFEPTLYLRPSDVDVAADPVAPESIELIQLSGAQPGLWVVRLYIAESGAVDELQLVDGRGSEANTQELLALLRTVRFTPALAEGRPVKSQKMLEFSFEPGPMPLAPTLVPPPAQGPSATGK